MAGAKSIVQARAYLKLLYQAVNMALLADNTSTTPLTDIYISLHTADPGKLGNQSTSEVAYTEYARVAVSRSESGFVADDTDDTKAIMKLAAAIEFATTTTGGNQVVTHAATGELATGAGNIIHVVTLNSNITLTNGESVTPKLNTDFQITEE